MSDNKTIKDRSVRQPANENVVVVRLPVDVIVKFRKAVASRGEYARILDR